MPTKTQGRSSNRAKKSSRTRTQRSSNRAKRSSPNRAKRSSPNRAKRSSPNRAKRSSPNRAKRSSPNRAKRSSVTPKRSKSSSGKAKRSKSSSNRSSPTSVKSVISSTIKYLSGTISRPASSLYNLIKTHRKKGLCIIILSAVAAVMYNFIGTELYLDTVSSIIEYFSGHIHKLDPESQQYIISYYDYSARDPEAVRRMLSKLPVEIQKMSAHYKPPASILSKLSSAFLYIPKNFLTSWGDLVVANVWHNFYTWAFAKFYIFLPLALFHKLFKNNEQHYTSDSDQYYTSYSDQYQGDNYSNSRGSYSNDRFEEYNDETGKWEKPKSFTRSNGNGRNKPKIKVTIV